ILRGFPRRTDGLKSTLSDLDLPGTILLAITLVGANLALSSGGDTGMQANRGLRAFGGTPNPLADHVPILLGVTVVGLVALVLWERRAPNPIMPVDLLRKPFYIAAVIANFLIGAALMVGMVNVPVIVSLVRDPDTVSRDSALLLAPLTLGVALAALASGRVARDIGAYTMTRIGIGLTVVGFAALYLLVDVDRIWQMAIGLGVAGIGIGLLLAPLSATALDAATSRHRGAATPTALRL